MNLIANNPYRIIGIPANATAREIQGRKAKITAFARVGKEISSDFDFIFLNNISLENEIIEKAFSDIEQNQDKVEHSLFWFLNQNSIDNTAIEYLKNGDKDKALEIWEKLTDEKEVSVKNFSAFNNLGTLYLLENSKDKIKQGITAKIKLIESDSFKDFVHTVADETYSINTTKQIELFVDKLISHYKDKLSTNEVMELFSNCNSAVQQYLSKKFTEEPVYRIEAQIEMAKKSRSNNRILAYQSAYDLFTNTKSELSTLKLILGTDNLQYRMLADNVAKELLQCSIDYFNESQKQGKNNDYLEDSLKISKWAASIAASEATKAKAREDIETLEGMKDRELSQAIEVLKSVKEAYEKNYNEIVKRAKKELGIYDENEYVEPGGEIKNIDKELSINFIETRSINYSAVDEAAKKSINWEKVIELINNVISFEVVRIIRDSEKLSKVDEYKSLVDFLLDKLNYSQKIQMQYLCYWKTMTSSYSSNTSTRTSTVAPRTITSSNKGGIPNWLKWVGGIALFLLIGGLLWGKIFFEALSMLSIFVGPPILIAWLKSEIK